MKAEELMIGDWVFCTYPSIKKSVRVEEIRTVGDDELKIIISDDMLRLVFAERYIEPISLTSEILEKNGFVWDTYHKSLQFVFGTTHICWGFYPNCLSVSDWADDSGNQISSLNCKFVHQLQHALRLCGIEKDIVI